MRVLLFCWCPKQLFQLLYVKDVSDRIFYRNRFFLKRLGMKRWRTVDVFFKREAGVFFREGLTYCIEFCKLKSYCIAPAPNLNIFSTTLSFRLNNWQFGRLMYMIILVHDQFLHISIQILEREMTTIIEFIINCFPEFIQPPTFCSWDPIKFSSFQGQMFI